MLTLNEADKVVHLVEDQWHYKTMVAAGYVAQTTEGIGFVRSYLYEHPMTQSKITVKTGISCDYWTDHTTGKGGYWSALAPHLASVASK